MALEYKFNGRDKLVKGYTYPIKRADLDAALEKAGVTKLRFVSYSCPRQKYDEKQSILSSRMLGEATMSGGWAHRTPYIIVSAVPASTSQLIKKLIVKNSLLDKLARWLNELEKAENVRRMKDQFFTADYHDEKLTITHS